VNVSLRGYAAHETVNIRWKKGSTWFHIAYVTTSSTGSANIDVRVPTFVPDGPTSVRGDGRYGRAQTNAVTVSGGTYRPSEATKTPTPSPTASPTATATIEPTQTPEASPSVDPTSPVSTPEASPTETSTEIPTVDTPTTEPTESATPAIEATATSEPTSTPIDDQATIEASQ
jgi:hypothetical protein